MKDQELKYWVAWNNIVDIGPKRFYKIIREYNSAENAWLEKSEKIAGFLKLNQSITQRFAEQKREINPDRKYELLVKKKVKAITVKDAMYPNNLKNIYLPPPILYYKGNLCENDKNAISIVGSRKATYYGKMIAETFSKKLSLSGLTIVSGLARGIDTIAHKGTLSVGGRTLAVLGSGIDIIYPPENRRLALEIEESGAVITEFALTTPPERQNFPRRNRIISGLSLGVLVVEAAVKSGALITSNYALDQGREIFAIPGSINSSLSAGPHNLIKEGAKLVHDHEDILAEIQYEKSGKIEDEKECMQLEGLSGDDLLIYQMLSRHQPIQIDEISSKANLPPGRVNTVMLSLELKDLIKELEGKNYIKI